MKQAYVLVLGLDVLGNPFGLLRGLSEGVVDLFYEPYQVRYFYYERASLCNGRSLLCPSTFKLYGIRLSVFIVRHDFTVTRGLIG